MNTTAHGTPARGGRVASRQPIQALLPCRRSRLARIRDETGGAVDLAYLKEMAK
jgi:hypothetical protein